MLNVVFHSLNITAVFSVPCFKGCHYSVFIIHVCSTSFTACGLPEWNEHPHRITTNHLKSFFSAPYGIFICIIQRCMSYNQSQLFRDIQRNCQRPDLSSLTLLLWQRVSAEQKATDTSLVMLHHAVKVESFTLACFHFQPKLKQWYHVCWHY